MKYLYLCFIFTLLTAATARAQQPFDGVLYPTGGAGQIATADFNLDGMPDFAFNGINGGVSIVLAQPTGGYAAPQTYDPGAPNQLLQIAAADLNADGFPDVAGVRTQAVATYINNGAAALQFASANALPPGQVTSFELHDIDGNGTQDFLLACPFNGAVYILYGDMAGGTTGFQTINSGLYAFHATAGDVNNDSIQDIAVVYKYTGIQTFPKPTVGATPWIPGTAVNVFYGIGGGAWSTPSAFTTATGPGRVILKDMNHDGSPDIVTASDYGGFVSNYNSKNQTYSIFAYNNTQIAVLFNNGSGQFAAAAISSIQIVPDQIFVADVNVDGQFDIIARNFSINQSVAWAAGNGLGAFAPSTILGGMGCNGIAIADVNGDLRPDIVATEAYGGSFVIFTSAANGKLTIEAGQFATAQDPQGLDAADMNGDGAADFVTANANAKNVSVLSATGPRSYGAPVNFTNPDNNSCNRVAITDLNGDSLADAVVGSDLSRMYIFLGDGAGHLSHVQTFLITSGASHYMRRVILADFDGDGSPDLLFGRSIPQLYKNSGAGTFSLLYTFPLVNNFSDLAAADMNLDGALDVVTNEIITYPGIGNGSFGAAAPLSPGLVQNVLAVAITDFNNDDLPDIVATGGPNLGPIPYARYFLQGDGALNFNLVSSLQGTTQYSKLATADINRDGFVDVLGAGTYPQAQMLTILGVGAGQFVELNPAFTNVSVDFTVRDFDSDGKIDAAFVGMPGNVLNPIPGVLSILYNIQPTAPGTSVYGAGTTGCRGRMGLSANSGPQIGNNNFALIGTNAPRRGLGVGLIGDIQDAAGHDYFGYNFSVLLDPYNSQQLLGYEVLADFAGMTYTSLPVPFDPQLQGLQLFAQQIFVASAADGDTCSPGAFELISSRGLALTIY